MKTNLTTSKILSRWMPLGLLTGFMVSCGSYNNTSYYDTDGVYNTGSNTVYSSGYTDYNQGENYYAGYFRQKNEDLQYFTSVEDYSSTNDSLPQRTTQAVGGYGGWGDETRDVYVNVYNDYWRAPYYNSYWYGGYYSPYYWGSSFSFGWNWGWGGYYSPWNHWYTGFGWGYPYYYGNYYPYHRYYNRNVVHNNGYRTGYTPRTSGNVSRSTYNSRNFNTDRTINNSRGQYNVGRRVDNSSRSYYNDSRTRSYNNRSYNSRSTSPNNTFNNRANSSNRTYNSRSYNSSNSSNRSYNSSGRSYSPSRSSMSSPSRSSFGGGSRATSSGRR